MKVNNVFAVWFSTMYFFKERFHKLNHHKFLTISKSNLSKNDYPELDIFDTLQEAENSIKNKKHNKETEILIYELRKCLKVSFKPEIKSCQ